jgi:hypothetical protein
MKLAPEMTQVKTKFSDETAFGFGWIAEEPALLERASHALRAGGRVWLVDPVDGQEVDAHVRALGEPAGVFQLVDRHQRDCALFAERYGVPHHRVPSEAPADSPFEVVRVLDVPGWRETALWWRDERALVCSEALGTTAYFLGPGERIAVHPFLRLYQPKALRVIARNLTPRHVLVGHGEGIHGEDVALATTTAIREARPGAPRWVAHQIRRRRRR